MRVWCAPRAQVRAELDRQRLALKAEGLKLAPLRAEAEERRRANKQMREQLGKRGVTLTQTLTPTLAPTLTLTLALTLTLSDPDPNQARASVSGSDSATSLRR